MKITVHFIDANVPPVTYHNAENLQTQGAWVEIKVNNDDEIYYSSGAVSKIETEDK